MRKRPRLVVAGLSGDSGKTVVSLAILLAAQTRGQAVRAFKKGPDYIDTAWLTWASGHPARNLDSYLMGFERASSSLVRHGVADGLNLIEGNRGLFDGADSTGTHSTAELAKSLGAPVVLVVSASKVTRTAAALVLGCQTMDAKVDIAGVILSKVSGARHEQAIRDAIESRCGIPVLGVVPRAPTGSVLPGRHLGLVTPEEHPGIGSVEATLRRLIEGRLEVGALLEIARLAPDLDPGSEGSDEADETGRGLRVGFLRDSAFTFYYPDNLEALERSGVTLVPIAAVSAPALPEIEALYIGGGFPETHGGRLAANVSFLASLGAAAASGLPIYAECGGLMLLARAIRWEGHRYPMAGVLPFDVEVMPTPQGHGYTELVVDRANPFFAEGLVLRGHEFHYSKVVGDGDPPPTACAVRRGSGALPGRDGVVILNVWASYTHLHALATREWASGLIGAARRRARARSAPAAGAAAPVRESRQEPLARAPGNDRAEPGEERP